MTTVTQFVTKLAHYVCTPAITGGWCVTW